MQRREFLQKSTLAGTALAGSGLLDYAMPMPIDAAPDGALGIAEALDIIEQGKEKNIRPEIRSEIRDNPRAVFIIETRVQAERNERGFFTAAQPQLEAAGLRTARSIFVRGSRKNGSTVIVPNFTSVPADVSDPTVGVITSPDFLAGFVEGLRGLGNTNTIASERGGTMESRRASGVYDIFDRHGIRLIESGYKTFADYRKNDLNWNRVPGSPMVWKEIPTCRPVGDPDCFFINMPKLKTHNLGLTTLSVKNLQGTVATGYGHYCNRWPMIESLARFTYETDFDRVFLPNYYENVEKAFLRHRAAGFRHWDIEGAYEPYRKRGGWEEFRKIVRDMRKVKSRTSEAKQINARIKEFLQDAAVYLMYDEMWAQRALDSASAIIPDINIVEGIIGRDGGGFNFGTDYLVNRVIAGLSKIEVDSVASHIMGQNPLELFYTRIAKERGLGENDPSKIDIYRIREDGGIERITPADLRQVRLGVNLHSWSKNGEMLFW